MNIRNGIIISIMLLLVIGVFGCTNNKGHNDQNMHHGDGTTSPYVGQEIERGIKSLSMQDIEGLKAGKGMPFGGMAKLAELNGYPGPRHVLDLSEQMELTDDQIQEIEKVYNDDMKAKAVPLGEQIIQIEKEINDAFVDGSITNEILEEKVLLSAQVYGHLRNVHLQAHLMMMDVLTKEQIQKYNDLRGYNSDLDPCENVPEGHSEEMWKQHHNCN